MKEISRESLHSSIRSKPIEVQDKFLEVANTLIRKGSNTSYAIQEANKAVTKFEEELALKTIAKQKEEQKQNRIKLEKALEGAVKLPPPVIIQDTSQVDPEEIESIYFDDEGKLIIRFGDGFIIKSKNIAPSKLIEERTAIAAQYPFFDWIQFNLKANVPDADRLPGMATWNELEDCLEVVQLDGTTLQLGLEQYIQVVNPSASALSNGSVVMFSGVNSNEFPEANLLLATPDLDPLYLIGVVTTDIAANSTGRATVFGKVRNIDTSAYNQGDLLWASPSIAGGLTNIKPFAPYPAISIAAVLKVHATEGVILVRPTIFPRSFYGVFSSDQIQTPLAINTPYAVTYNVSEFSSGVSIVNSSQITVAKSGLYSFDFRMQVTSNNSSQKNIYIWGRHNGVDISNSATKVTMTGNGVDIAPSWNFIHLLNAGDNFQIMYAVDDTAISISSPIQTAFCPSTPSVTLRVNKFDS